MMIAMMIIIKVSKTENICGRRPLPPIISHSFPLSNCALSSIGSRKVPVEVEVGVLLLSHRKIPLQLCSQQRIGVKPITNGGKSYFSSQQVCKMLCFIVIWRYLDSLGGDIKKLKSGNSSTSTQIASLVDFPKRFCIRVDTTDHLITVNIIFIITIIVIIIVLIIIMNIKIIIIIVNWIISGTVEEITMSRVPCSQSSVIRHNSSRDSGARVVEYIWLIIIFTPFHCHISLYTQVLWLYWCVLAQHSLVLNGYWWLHAVTYWSSVFGYFVSFPHCASSNITAHTEYVYDAPSVS